MWKLHGTYFFRNLFIKSSKIVAVTCTCMQAIFIGPRKFCVLTDSRVIMTAQSIMNTETYLSMLSRRVGIWREAKGVSNDPKSPDVENKCSTPKEHAYTQQCWQVFLRITCYSEKNRDCRKPTVALRRSEGTEYSCGPSQPWPIPLFSMEHEEHVLNKMLKIETQKKQMETSKYM